MAMMGVDKSESHFIYGVYPGQSMAMMGVDESDLHFIYGVNHGQSMAIDCSDGVETMANSDEK